LATNSRDTMPIRPTTNQVLCPQNNPQMAEGSLSSILPPQPLQGRLRKGDFAPVCSAYD